MNENKIELKSINHLLDLNFFIPSYQRGYRWTKQQVVDLLDDIWEFAEKERKKDEFYCLQPVVVKDSEEAWEVIDGQQRLTTILIILYYFNQTQFKTPKKIFELSFETRKGSADFLKDIRPSEKEKNIDYFHICNAYEEITEWFTNKETENPAIANEFYPILINSTKVIWYHVNDGSDSRDIFTRINMGKIPLTNAELIKALFLRDENFERDTEIIRLKQLEIASEWDRIEYSLQNSEFWYFLNREESERPTRIEFIFDLMSNKNNNEEYFTFRHFNNKLNGDSNKNRINIVWKEVKEHFLTFDEWFNNNELYHLIGFLITIGADISELKNDSKEKTKTEFKSYLRNNIKEYFNKCQISNLEYGKNNKLIIQLLLLFNIQTILSSKESYSRFPFDKFKNENWSLEHIHAQNSDGLITVSQWNTWLNEHAESLDRIDAKKYAGLITEINNKNDKNITKEIFDELFEKVLNAFNEKNTFETMHEIANLTLLDKDSNSALNKSIFEIKRKRIIEREKSDTFIPICTRNVFLKYYSNTPEQLFYWNEKDRNDYIESIKETLANYLPEQTKELNS